MTNSPPPPGDDDRSPRRVIPIATTDEKVVGFFEAHKKVYPRTIRGVFARWRWAAVIVTQLVFYGLPWLEWGQRQAVLFDLATRRFYVLGLVLYPQDLIYLTGMLVICAISLFLFTAVAGRLWCGYACPQSVYSEIFMWIEEKIEGNRAVRMRLDSGKLTLEKLVKKSAKQIIWIAVALWTGLTFVGYFTPIRELSQACLQMDMGRWATFWMFFYGFVTYGFAGYMREQVCKYMCPYARFQSAMFDRDTLIVSYDAERGEPRGMHARGVDARSKGLGDCIDCKLCVQVCPIGIDIRNGLQYECIGCGLCVDACDTMMDKLALPRGLVRYATQNGMAQRWSRKQVLQRVLRLRVLIYSGVLLALSIGLVTSLVMRAPFKVDVVRDRGTLARIVEDGRTENVYSLQIMNATERTQRYHIEVRGLNGLRVFPEALVEVGSTDSRWVAVRVQLPYGAAEPGVHPVYFDIRAVDDGVQISEKATFMVPQ